MPIKTMTPTKQQIDVLRKKFIEKCEKNPPPEPFHPVDMDRVRNDDVWCTRFLEMYDLDMNVSFEKLWSTCIWRQQYGANELNETNLRMDYLTDGVIFPHNKDKDGKILLIFKTKLHVRGVKDMNEVLKVLVYWIERVHRESHMDKCTIFFDMDGTGLTNMDLDFIKMIIETFKMYYPNALNYIIVFEMAWVLSAAFKIVKALLPEKAVEILKVIKKKDINQYIDKDNCLESWGGNDSYQFSFVPEKRTPAPAIENPSNNSIPSPISDDLNNNSNDKTVHFAKSSLHQNSGAEQQPQMHDIPEHFTPQDHDMLRVSPQDYLKFARNEYKESTLELTSTSLSPVTYKIQTTSPEKFRVRPRIGILNPGESISVTIFLKREHNLSENGKDKFLIMCLPAAVESIQNTDFWKKVDNNDPNIEQHRLCCVYPDTEIITKTAVISNGYSASNAGDKNLETSTKLLTDETKRLEKQLRNTQFLQLATLLIVIILSAAVIYLLKLQLCNDSGCFNNEEPTSNIDFGSCAKGKADL